MKPAIEVESQSEAMTVVPLPKQESLTLFRTDDPQEVIVRASAIATALRDVIAKQGLISNIKGKQYPKCEAWTLCGTMLGVFPIPCWTRPVEHGWEARVEVKTKDGSIIGGAEAQCLRTERNWADRDDFALRSMAQTRATAKALRMPLGFIMTLAGYCATPAEEMMQEQDETPRKAPIQPQGQKTTIQTPSANQNASQSQPEPKRATQAQLDRLVTTLEPMKDQAIGYFQSIKQLGPNQTIINLSLEHCPTTKKQFDDLLEKIKAFAEGAAEPTTEIGKSTQEEAWRTFKMPWGAHKGVELDKIALPQQDRIKYLFGLWKNQKDGPLWPQDFKDALAECAKHYGFDKPKEST